MDLLIKNIIPNFILVSSLIYIWYKLENKQINLKNKRLYITLVSLIIISIFNYFLVNKFIKITLITLVFMIFYKYLFKENLQKSIITPIYYQALLMISETLYALLISLLFRSNAQIVISSYLGIFITNVAISFISIALVQFKIVNTIYNKIISFTDKIKFLQLLLFCIFAIAIANILLMTAYYKIEFKYLLIFNFILIFACLSIVLYSFIIQNNYNKVSDKYNVAINSLTDYENMMSKYKIANHENKNLLLTVRAMILNKDKDIPMYIDSIIQDKYDDDDRLLFKMSVIPSGGLRATIYSEILKIKDNKINYELNIDKNIKTIDLIEMDTITIIEICKIIGVFIDNAIDETKHIKDNIIIIDLFVDKNKLNVKISNNYKKKFDIDKICDEGYTTKGKGHGYGLSLVKNIIEKSKNFQNRAEINNNIFSQILIIDYKSKHR